MKTTKTTMITVYRKGGSRIEETLIDGGPDVDITWEGRMLTLRGPKINVTYFKVAAFRSHVVEVKK